MKTSQLYTALFPALLAPRTPATQDEAQMLGRLADRVMENAAADGEQMTRRQAIVRARENLAHVMQMALWKGITS